MAGRNAAVAAYIAALTSPGEHAASTVAAVLADGVVVQTSFGRAAGIAAAIELLAEPRTAGLLAGGAEWSAPEVSGEQAVVTATLPAAAPFSRLELTFGFDGDKIALVEQQTRPARPPSPQPLVLTDEITEAVNGALDNQTPMLIAYADEAGQPHLSYRGTVQAYSRDQLALWARDPDGGLPRAVATRPRVTLMYHDPSRRTTYTFYGRARLEQEPGPRAAIFENSHVREQHADFRRRGVAIVVDLDKIEGRSASGRLLLQREAPQS